MTLLISSFIAGVLTVLAPCSLSLLPIILGKSAAGKDIRKASIVILSLSVSIFLFTLLLKASTLLIDIPDRFWPIFSGIVITIFGVITLWPNLWEAVSIKLNLQQIGNKGLQNGAQKEGLWSDVLTGVALGPIFSSCSPTYSLIVVQVLPATFGLGVLYLLSYILGLALLLFLIALLGNKIIRRLRFFANPDGMFKKVLGVILIVIGLMILTGLDKSFEAFLLDYEFLNFTNLEFELFDL